MSAARRFRSSRGMVTAEAAMVLPVLICVAVALAWMVLLGVAQVRCVDAAREAARLAARGESTAVVSDAVSRLAPHDARWSVREEDGLVVAEVSASVRPRLPLVGQLPAVHLASEAVAAEEPG